MAVCSSCNTGNPEVAKFCLGCGKPIPQQQETLKTSPVDSSILGKTCPFCQTPFKQGDDVVLCQQCSMPHHRACWNGNGGSCTTFGCSGSNTGYGLGRPTETSNPGRTGNKRPLLIGTFMIILVLFSSYIFYSSTTNSGTITLQDGSTYTGEYKNGIPHGTPHGYGSLSRKDGTKYEGNFSQGMFQGSGKLIQSSGMIYTGNFDKGKFSGKGTYVKVDGTIKYEGEFANGVIHGKGVLTQHDNLGAKSYEEGEFENGKLYNGRRTTDSSHLDISTLASGNEKYIRRVVIREVQYGQEKGIVQIQ